MSKWQDLIPQIHGTLPGGVPLRRTECSGPTPAKVAFLGVYPALTEKKMFTVGDNLMWLPTQVEAQSFAPASKSGAEIEDNYLAPLALTRSHVFIFDMVPYFLANTSTSSSGRSMADNVHLYEESTGTLTGITARPKEEEFLQYANEMPGNLDRLADYMGKCQPELLFTLGTEPAAFVRRITFTEAASQVDQLLYADPIDLDVFGTRTRVVHLVHPHHFIKRTKKWVERHREWCVAFGQVLSL